MSTDMRSASTPKSQWASITSNPLFTSVAESIVIFAPMRHCGCLRASSGVTSGSSSAGTSRRAPPLHVIMRRRTGECSPARHWNMAECSESMGRMGTWRCAARRITRSPPTTSVSLFARAIFFPAFMAATVGTSPAYPTSAFTTTSTSCEQTTCRSDSSPVNTLIGYDARALFRASYFVGSVMTAHAASNSMAWRASSCQLLRAVSDVISNRSGFSRTISSVCTPIDPVDPSMESRCFIWWG